jgi:putative transposase
MTEDTLNSTPITKPDPDEVRQHLCLDKGYDYDEIYFFLDGCYEAHISQRVDSVPRLRSPGRRKARRWVVERTHSWMNRFRRILIRWEKYAENYVGFLHLVSGIIAFRAAGVLG